MMPTKADLSVVIGEIISLKPDTLCAYLNSWSYIGAQMYLKVCPQVCVYQLMLYCKISWTWKSLNSRISAWKIKYCLSVIWVV